MKNTKLPRRLAALLLVLAYMICLCMSAYADDASEEAEELPPWIKGAPEGDYHGKTVILVTGDTSFCDISGFSNVAWLKEEFERLGAEAVLVHTGNCSTGPILSSSKGGAAIELMNLSGCDVACLGRYEFTYGYDALKRNLQRAAFPFLCANAAQRSGTDGTEDAICAPNYTYTTRSGVTVGFFGLLTPNATLPTTSDADQSRQLVILPREEAYLCAQEQINTLRQGGSSIPGADLVIGVSSIGSDGQEGDLNYSSLDIMEHIQGLDLMIDGGSGSVMVEGPGGEAIISVGSEFANIGVVVIDDETKTLEDRWMIPPENLGADATVAEAVAMIDANFNVEYGTVFARTDSFLDGEAVPGVRTKETNLGDLLADAMLWYAKQAIKEWDVDDDHIICITNGAGIRASIPAGDVTRFHVSTSFPFANTVSVVYISGAELLETLEAATWSVPEKTNSYPQSSGIRFTLDTRIPYDEGELYPGSQYARPASIKRVQIESIHGQPYDPDAMYAVVTNNYLASGGDTYYVFGNAKTRVDTDTYMDLAVMDYIHLSLGNVITEAMYGKVRGDHTQIVAQVD